jgi:hypothetical protein
LADWPAPDTPRAPLEPGQDFRVEAPAFITSTRIAMMNKATSNNKPAPQQGIVRDEKGQEQPADKERAQHVSRKDKGDDPPGQK